VRSGIGLVRLEQAVNKKTSKISNLEAFQIGAGRLRGRRNARSARLFRRAAFDHLRMNNQNAL